jgi:glycosyltransferase involved in cell wall biosynthesis
MTIAILGSRGIPARYGGFETFAERLAVGLSERGYDVTVFCERQDTTSPPLFGQVKLSYVSAPAWGPLQTLIFDLRCLWRARKDYDIVYMLGYGAALFCVIPRLWGSQVWINPDGLEWARAKWGFVARTYFKCMEWLSLRVADHIVADCFAIANSLRERHASIPACTVIPYGCEIIDVPPQPQTLSKWGLNSGGYFLLVCRLEPENHVFEVLKAFSRSDSKRELVVVGNLEPRTPYVAKLLSIHDSRIRTVGTVYCPQELTALRFYAFGYLHGHSVGGTNPSLLEAMGCGNLILAHDNSFNRETLADTGLFFSSVAGLTQIFDKVETGDEDLNLLRQKAKERARSQYHWPDIVNRYISLIDAVTEGRG